jgi:siroheme synthase-like protein
MNTNTLFPVFLQLEHIPVLIIGGGNVALEKLNALLSNNQNATIHLVANKIKSEIYALAKTYPNIFIYKKKYTPADLDKARIVIVATDDRLLSVKIYQQAKVKGLLVNVADTPYLCDFYLSSIVQKGNVKIAISTNGKSPTLAKRLKQILTEIIPDNISETAHILYELRQQFKGTFAEKVNRMNEYTKALIEK